MGGPAVYLDTSRSEVVDATAGAPSLIISGEDFVLGASYERLGPDLLLSGDDHSVFIKGYFTHEEAPDLYTSDGNAVVRGSVATRLAGPATPGQFAQADAIPGLPPVGIVDNIEGRVFLSRLDGTNVLAEPGTPVFLGDIVESEGGSSIGITFVDDSTFALGESGRMIIDELVYDPVDGTGESAFNVLKGVFSFVSGDIAATGDDATIVAHAGTGMEYLAAGRVRRVEQALSARTRLAQVIVSIPGANPFLLGEYVRGSFDGVEERALIAPRDALLPTPEGLVVYTVRNGRAVQHPARIVVESDSLTGFQADGVSAGDSLVVSGLVQLSDSLRVRPTR